MRCPGVSARTVRGGIWLVGWANCTVHVGQARLPFFQYFECFPNVQFDSILQNMKGVLPGLKIFSKLGTMVDYLN
jgi:hypothetical protein